MSHATLRFIIVRLPLIIRKRVDKMPIFKSITVFLKRKKKKKKKKKKKERELFFLSLVNLINNFAFASQNKYLSKYFHLFRLFTPRAIMVLLFTLSLLV